MDLLGSLFSISSGKYLDAYAADTAVAIRAIVLITPLASGVMGTSFAVAGSSLQRMA